MKERRMEEIGDGGGGTKKRGMKKRGMKRAGLRREEWRRRMEERGMSGTTEEEGRMKGYIDA